MILIRDLVRETLALGYLTVESEDRLRQLLRSPYDLEDWHAFMRLQYAVVSGVVRQESRDRAARRRMLATAM